MFTSEPSLIAEIEVFTEPPIVELVEPVAPIPFRMLAPQPLKVLEPVADELLPRPPEEWLRRICLAILEVLHGRRNPAQLRGVVSAKLLEQLNLRRAVTRPSAAPLIISLRVGQPIADALEVGVSFSSDSRIYPMALRLELHQAKWIVTACEVGPH